MHNDLNTFAQCLHRGSAYIINIFEYPGEDLEYGMLMIHLLSCSAACLKNPSILSLLTSNWNARPALYVLSLPGLPASPLQTLNWVSCPWSHPPSAAQSMDHTLPQCQLTLLRPHPSHHDPAGSPEALFTYHALIPLVPQPPDLGHRRSPARPRIFQKYLLRF